MGSGGRSGRGGRRHGGDAIGRGSANDRLLKRLKTAVQQLDADEAASCYAKNALFVNTVNPREAAIRGREKIRSLLRDLFSTPDARFEVKSIFGCGGWAAAEWIWSGASPQDNHRFKYVGASIFQVRGNKIARETIYYGSQSQ